MSLSQSSFHGQKKKRVVEEEEEVCLCSLVERSCPLTHRSSKTLFVSISREDKISIKCVSTLRVYQISEENISSFLSSAFLAASLATDKLFFLITI